MIPEEKYGRKKAIRLKCLDCCCGSAMEVRLCESRKCPLWRFRMGRESQAESAADSSDSKTNQEQEAPPRPTEESG